MEKLRKVLILSLFVACQAASPRSDVTHTTRESRKFPDNFVFGVATASYQVEGAWNASDKGVNIWDHLTHTNPTAIDDDLNGDEAADSYKNYKRDVEMCRELGVDFYRISLSWPRILPTGFADKISRDGVQYYNNLINELLEYNIEPYITLYHWDLPQSLQDLGGWANPLIVDWFSDYARVVYEQFGDRVKNWITINEPKQICLQGYGGVDKAPLVNAKGIGEYYCSYNLILAHAKAYHVYNDDFKHFQNGRVGITVSSNWNAPYTDSETNIQAADDFNQFDWGQYYHPIYAKDGDYPEVLKRRVASKSIAQGFPRSRLPQFTDEQIAYVKGTSDFLGLNHYTTMLVSRDQSLIGSFDVPSYMDDLEAEQLPVPGVSQGASSWLWVVPWGLRSVLNYFREHYGNPETIIFENGYSTRGAGGLDDEERATYYEGYLNAVLDAIGDGCRVTGYTAWSLMDNFEWMRGYTERFGLYEVDFESPEKTRTAKKSALVYKEIIRSRVINPDYRPTTLDIQIG